jgi:hypothetical protein
VRASRSWCVSLQDVGYAVFALARSRHVRATLASHSASIRLVAPPPPPPRSISRRRVNDKGVVTSITLNTGVVITEVNVLDCADLLLQFTKMAKAVPVSGGRAADGCTGGCALPAHAANAERAPALLCGSEKHTPSCLTVPLHGSDPHSCASVAGLQLQ